MITEDARGETMRKSARAAHREESSKNAVRLPPKERERERESDTKNTTKRRP